MKVTLRVEMQTKLFLLKMSVQHIIIIFLVDVQDIPRYKLALQYFEEIVNYLIETEIKPQISIFLHKFDPSLEEIKNFDSETIASRLLNRINSIIPSELEYHIFKTTIFTVFQKTLLQ